MPHPINRRYWAEDLMRLRRSDEQQRFAASQRRGRIDPNPHQIDAVIFALSRIREGGCILADEVGLGKTIEAGLVMAQLLAEGARRVLLILPKALLGQWKNELYDLFSIESQEGGHAPQDFEGGGVFLVGREFAGSEKGSATLKMTEPFDLCVIDEAHEIFAGIYRRYDKNGDYKFDSTDAQTAHRVRQFLGTTPVMLLTATPIQNRLTELWGLVQYVDPTGTLLGKLPVFRHIFCEPGTDDRMVAPEQVNELRRRINTVCQRTLRRQAQEFLERPFTRRQAQIFEYSMSEKERSLYDDVTDYLLEPELCAFRGNQRKLLLIGFHRLMASSIPALAASLKGVANRLRVMLGEKEKDESAAEAMIADLEGEGIPDEEDDEETKSPTAELIRAELERVESFYERAQALPDDGKSKRLVEAMRMILERGRSGEGSGKVVIFTESITTQNYIAKLLRKVDLGLTDSDITVFRGDNSHSRAAEAYEQWQEEIGRKIPVHSRPSKQIGIRLALLHEFKTRSSVFISTEAGGKGLNLQFCDTLINYDLPWNPQRIEQRIGRCHRYAQDRDVTVINFLAQDNEAQKLTFQILSEKLDLFGKVLDASDVVLHESETDAPENIAMTFGSDFESELRRIYERSRSKEEIEEGLRKLNDRMGKDRERFDEVQNRTTSLIESKLDNAVGRVFRQIAEGLPQSLAELDDRICRLIAAYLDAVEAPCKMEDVGERVFFHIEPSTSLPEGLQEGLSVAVGHARDLADAEPLHLGHPLVHEAVAEARAASAESISVRYSADADERLKELRGQRGRLVVVKAKYGGFEPVEHLLPVALTEGDPEPVASSLARSLLDSSPTDADLAALEIDEEDLEEEIDEALFVDQSEVHRPEQERFERMLEQIERYIDDQILILRREKARLEEDQEAFQRRRDTALGADARKREEEALMKVEEELDKVEERLSKLYSREDEDYQKWRNYAHERRYVKPTTERILDVVFEVV